MQSQSEDIVSNKPGLTQGLQHKGLREPVGRIIVSLTNIAVYSLYSPNMVTALNDGYLQLSQDIDEDSPVKHWLAVYSGDDVLNLLEGETSELLHDLGGPLHLLTLKRQEGLLWVVELLEVGPDGIEVRIIHILKRSYLVAALSKIL